MNEELEQKAREGDAESQCILGWGAAGRENYIAAAGWFTKAADQCHSEAQYSLGQLYHYGKGVTQNDQEAVKWYREAAGQGHVMAQNSLKWMHEHGRGVTQDDKASGEK